MEPIEQEPELTAEDLEIVELPEREAMLKIGPVKLQLNNIRLFNNL
jgi:hypothetical protein